MSTIKIGNTAGNYDLNVLDLSLNGLMNTKFNDYEWSSDKKGNQTLTMIQNKSNYLELEGEFSIKAFASKDIAKVVREVTSLTVVEDGKVSYTISGMDLLSKNLASEKALAAYIDDETYKVYGNGGDNVIAAASHADQLYGNGGNDELYSLGGADKLYGGTGKDILSGGSDNDMLSGDEGDDKLDGGDGNDTLNGGDGSDKLKGGDGNDTYLIDKYDTITEAKKGGTDTVNSDASVDLRKFAYIEELILTGTKAINATGDAGANSLTGNSGANTIWGGKGIDILEGGKGADVFQFVKGDGRDTILDFDGTGKGQDHIDLDDYGSNLKFKTLDIEKLGKHDVDIDFGHGDHLILKDVNIKDIDASDFQF